MGNRMRISDRVPVYSPEQLDRILPSITLPDHTSIHDNGINSTQSGIRRCQP